LADPDLLSDGRWRFDCQQGIMEEFFLFVTAFRPLLEPIHPPIQQVSEGLSLGAKRPRPEVDHSQSRGEVRNASIHLYKAWCLVKYRMY
jgi:hypothetical protein